MRLQDGHSHQVGVFSGSHPLQRIARHLLGWVRVPRRPDSSVHAAPGGAHHLDFLVCEVFPESHVASRLLAVLESALPHLLREVEFPKVCGPVPVPGEDFGEGVKLTRQEEILPRALVVVDARVFRVEARQRADP